MSKTHVPDAGSPEPEREHPISPEIHSDHESDGLENKRRGATQRSEGFDFDPVFN